jgi:hypothetical protein
VAGCAVPYLILIGGRWTRTAVAGIGAALRRAARCELRSGTPRMGALGGGTHGCQAQAQASRGRKVWPLLSPRVQAEELQQTRWEGSSERPHPQDSHSRWWGILLRWGRMRMREGKGSGRGESAQRGSGGRPGEHRIHGLGVPLPTRVHRGVFRLDALEDSASRLETESPFFFLFPQ